MNACILFLALISKPVVSKVPGSYYDVGTVLFSPSALSKSLWTSSEIGLLRARKQFLDITPPLYLLSTQSEDFTRLILDYFLETFTTVKMEATDFETDRLLTTALSDIVGGYLKKWVLPITKFAYYGGTVPQEDALKLFQFHEDIKRYLKTDGKNWHNPDIYFLNSMSVNVAPLNYNVRNTRESCDSLAYFEKTNNSVFAIPLPNVNWAKDYECMFIPLKDQRPVSLNCPNSSSALFKYYNTAMNCIKTNNVEDGKSFDDRLQNWLESDVIPHLNDERIYPALRSILSLVNKTRSLCDNVIDLYSEAIPHDSRTSVAGIPVDLSSKKMMVITIIILLEIAWCIPTLCYLIFSKIKKKKNKSNVCFLINPKKPPKQANTWTDYYAQCETANMTNSVASKEMCTSPIDLMSTGIGQSPQTRSCTTELGFLQMSRHSMGTGTRTNFVCQSQPCYVNKTDRATSQKSMLLKTSSIMNPCSNMQNIHPKYTGEITCACPDNETESKTGSFITVRNLQPTKTMTLIQKNSQTGKNNEKISFVNETEKSKMSSTKRRSKESKRNAKIASSSPVTEYFKRRPHSSSKEMQNTVFQKASKITTKHSDRNVTLKSKKSPSQKNHKVSERDTRREETIPKNYVRPILEITLDEPNGKMTYEVKSPKPLKPSKIPKRFLTNSVTQTLCVFQKTRDSDRKSLIPQPKRRYTVDDIIIQDSEKKSNKDGKMNKTL